MGCSSSIIVQENNANWKDKKSSPEKEDIKDEVLPTLFVYPLVHKPVSSPLVQTSSQPTSTLIPQTPSQEERSAPLLHSSTVRCRYYAEQAKRIKSVSHSRIITPLDSTNPREEKRGLKTINEAIADGELATRTLTAHSTPLTPPGTPF